MVFKEDSALHNFTERNVGMFDSLHNSEAGWQAPAFLWVVNSTVNSFGRSNMPETQFVPAKYLKKWLLVEFSTKLVNWVWSKLAF